MIIDVPVTFRFLNILEVKFTDVADPDITAALSTLLEQGVTMSAELDRLTTEVAETKAGVASAIRLIQGLAQQIRDNATDPVALNALADDLDAQQKDLADAVVAAGTNPAPPAP
jgi:hypothetical protein